MTSPSSLGLVWRWLSTRRRRQLVGLGFLSVLGAAAELATLAAVVPFLSLLAQPGTGRVPPWVVTVFSRAGLSVEGAALWSMTAVFAFVVVTAACILLAVTWGNIRFTQGLGHDLGRRIYRRVLHQPYQYHVSKNTSEILSGVEKVNAVVVGVLRPSMDAATATVMAAAMLLGLFFVDRIATASAMLMVGVVYLSVTGASRAKVLRNSRIASRGQTERIQALQEGLGGIRDILLDRSQHFHEARFERIDNAFRKALVENALWGQAPRFVVEAFGVAIIAGLAVIVTTRTGGIGAALPVLGALALGAQRLLPLVQRMYSGWNQVMANRGALEDLSLLLEGPVDDDASRRGDPTRLPFERELSFEDVGFRYSEQGPWVFRHVMLRITRGMRVGIVGETGGGKSTFLDVLMGLLPPSEGSITIDGAEVTRANVADWQARIAHVPQAIFLADTSIAENIAFGLPSERIDLVLVHDAARRAHIHDFIASLPDGYRTQVGERGVRLSGGQRQRIGVARALYRRADVLILDEATSALDAETESSVMESIRQVGGDITIFIVAHRLSTLDGCDTILRVPQLIASPVDIPTSTASS